MREIKFRAWDKEFKKFATTALKYAIEDINFLTDYEWMQNTGVNDDSEDEVEIFEGDIVELIYEQEKHICKVKYEVGGFMFVENNLPDGYLFFTEIVEVDRDYIWIPDSKVIGNIYENPELLEV